MSDLIKKLDILHGLMSLNYKIYSYFMKKVENKEYKWESMEFGTYHKPYGDYWKFNSGFWITYDYCINMTIYSDLTLKVECWEEKGYGLLGRDLKFKMILKINESDLSLFESEINSAFKVHVKREYRKIEEEKLERKLNKLAEKILKNHDKGSNN